jgi:phosphoglycolate phosphatase
VRWDDTRAGVARFYVEDPWGNRLELMAAQAARDERGGAAADDDRRAAAPRRPVQQDADAKSEVVEEVLGAGSALSGDRRGPAVASSFRHEFALAGALARTSPRVYGAVLLLFDIDGTLLIRAHVEHRLALAEAVREVWGVDDPGPSAVPAAGRTDGEIAREICLLAGVDAARIDALWLDFHAACARAYARVCPPDLRDRLAPHVPDVLADLAARPGVRLSLVTGNFEPVARVKLHRAGLDHYFPAGQGGFGSDAEDRTELPAIARRRAGDGHAPYPRERTIVIGDTPNDIACARADRLRCVAVATGPYAAADLRAADAVIAGLDKLPGLLVSRPGRRPPPARS